MNITDFIPSGYGWPKMATGPGKFSHFFMAGIISLTILHSS